LRRVFHRDDQWVTIGGTLVAFLLGCTLPIAWGRSVRYLYRDRTNARFCQENLRLLYVAVRHLPPALRSPTPSLAATQALLGEKMWFMTQREVSYVRPWATDPSGEYVVHQYSAFVCPNDPDRDAKHAIANSHSFAYVPSYEWCPDERTLVYCPFHRFRVLRDGTFVEEGQ